MATKGLCGARADTAAGKVAVTGKGEPIIGPQGFRIGSSRRGPCPECSGWDPGMSSACTRSKTVCPTCGRTQCWNHRPYPMSTEEEAMHFLKSAILRTDKRCFVRQVHVGRFVRWRTFTSEADYRTYVRTRTHRR